MTLERFQCKLRESISNLVILVFSRMVLSSNIWFYKHRKQFRLNGILNKTPIIFMTTRKMKYFFVSKKVLIKKK